MYERKIHSLLIGSKTLVYNIVGEYTKNRGSISMNSLTKNHQKEENIIKMVENAFEHLEAIKVTELKEGFFNVAYLIKLSDEREVILKIAPPQNAIIMSYEKNLMWAEVKSMRLIKEKTTVPIPDILFYSAEHNTNTYNLCDSDYFFMTKLEGLNYNSIKTSLTEQERYQIGHELGQYNRQFNEIEGNNFGYYAFAKDNSGDWKTVFQKMIKEVLQDGIAKNTDIGIDYEILWNQIEAKLYTLESVKTPKFVHWDLWDGNVFIKDGHVEGIIDFERAIWGDPLMEVVFRSFNIIEQQKSFLDGYGEIEQNQDAKIRCILYDIYLYLIMIIECDYRQYTDNGQYNWAKNMLVDAVEGLRH